MIAKELISENIHVLRTTDSVDTAIDYLATQGLMVLPILSQKELYNYGRLDFLYAIEDKSQELQQCVAANPHAPRALEQQHLYELVPLLASNELSVLAVEDRSGGFVGCIDQKQINKAITQSLTYRGIGAVLVLEMEERDFSPATIARWVEENGAKVLGLMLSQQDYGRLKVNLKVNTTFVRSLVATLNRQGFPVTQVYLSEDNNDDNDQEIDLALRFFDL
jgi:predicted transcriptional regulator